jgi:hypothetical protein
VIWTWLLSPEAALASWRERSTQQPEPLLEVLRWLYVHLADGSVWASVEAADPSAPPELVRVADSLLQIVKAATEHYAARAGLPWRELRFDTTTGPMAIVSAPDVSAPDVSQLAAMPAGTAVLLRWRRIYRTTGRSFDQALLGVHAGGDRWLVREARGRSTSTRW